jgi:hypothetical protein
MNITRKSRFLKYTKRFLLFLICILMIGYSYQKIGNYFDMKKYPPPGQLVKVNGHDMHVFSKGNGKKQ